MGELNALLYGAVKNDATYQTLTGGTAADPRIYKQRTPVELPVSDTKPAYSVYYESGTIDPGLRVDDVGRNDAVYMLECYATTDVLLSQVTSRLERLFDYQRFETTSYYVGHTRAHCGGMSFDDGRQLYFQTVTVFMKLVRAKSA